MPFPQQYYLIHLQCRKDKMPDNSPVRAENAY